jgi:hypothetical protein
MLPQMNDLNNAFNILKYTDLGKAYQSMISGRSRNFITPMSLRSKITGGVNNFWFKRA